MRTIATFLFAITLFITSCDSFKTYEVENLYGKWKGDVWSFTFEEDGSCEVVKNGNKLQGETTWRAVTMSNTLEFVANGKVFMANVTVKGIENDTLTLEMRPMIGGGKSELSTEIYKLARVE